MKKLFLLLSASVVLFSCSKVGKGEYIITGIAKGIENGKTIILETQDPSGMGLIAVDTVKVENGKFEIKGKVTEPSFHTIQLQDANGKIPFILESGEITVEINKDTIQESKISGTYNNDEYVAFNKEIREVQKKLIDFQTQKTQAMNQAQQAKDTAVINGLMKQYTKIQEEVGNASKTKYIAYAETHPKSFISALIIQGMLGDPTADVKKTEAIYNGFEDELKNTKPGKAIKEKLTAMKSPSVGATAPAAPGQVKWRTDFSAPNPEGKVISLKESLGKVTIVDFWASWCGPCRRENPNVVAIYKELHSKGLNIIGVSLDENPNKWKEAIAKDKLTWNQVSNLKGWQEPIAAQYKVESIPATFILDVSGKIVAKDLRGAELRAKIIELLAK